MENRKYIDLHLHTTCSDGERTPEEMIHDTREAGLSAIALTDHNCFAIREPMVREGLEVIPGAEFSTYYEASSGNKKEVHILGLFFERVDPALDHVFDCIEKDAYIKAILRKLKELGMKVELEDILREFPKVRKIGRCHVAETMVKMGYASDRDDAMDRWIGNFSPYYLNPVEYVHYVDFEEGIRQIAAYGGLPILAHPYHYKYTEEQIEEMIQRFRSVSDGPMGIEVYYQTYGEREITFLKRMAEKYDLLMSASSDNHFRSRPFVKGDYELLEKMKQAMGVKR
ncbi:MAG: PHP domain-containing protein [Eubacteriales bacterium]|nr:PHP domain-containing protein [Eubacteriales bacterium]